MNKNTEKQYLRKQYEKLAIIEEKIFNNPVLEARAIKFRQKYQIPVKGLPNISGWEKWQKEFNLNQSSFIQSRIESGSSVTRQSPVNEFTKDIEEIMYDLSIDKHFYDGIKCYLVRGIKRLLAVNMTSTVRVKANLLSHQEEYSIIPNYIADGARDMGYALRYLKDVKQAGNKKIQPVPNFKLYKRSYELLQKMPASQAVQIIEDEFPGNHSQNLIHKYAQRFREQIDSI